MTPQTTPWPPSITCPRCGRTSYHPVDVRERYCGFCHIFHDDLQWAPGALRCPRCDRTLTEPRILVGQTAVTIATASSIVALGLALLLLFGHLVVGAWSASAIRFLSDLLGIATAIAVALVYRLRTRCRGCERDAP